MKKDTNLEVPADWKEVTQLEFDYTVSQIHDAKREVFANGVRYIVVDHVARTNQVLALEMDDGKRWLHPMFFTGDKPDLSAINAVLGGEDDDGAKVARLWVEFKYELKKALMTDGVTWSTIAGIIKTTSQRAGKLITDQNIRTQVKGRFLVMLRRAEEFIKDPTAGSPNELCPKCNLNRFICNCEKQDPKLQ